MFYLLRKNRVITKEIIDPLPVAKQSCSSSLSSHKSNENMNLKTFHFKSGNETVLDEKRKTFNAFNAEEILATLNIESN